MPAGTYEKLTLSDGSVLFVAQTSLWEASNPTGTIFMFGAAAAPEGWLLCDGGSYLRTQFKDLYAVIGVTYGAVDGTHFSVPDMRGTSPIGAGTGTGLTNRVLGTQGGTETHQLTTNQIPSHSHIQNAHNHTPAGGDTNFVDFEGSGSAGLAIASGGTKRTVTGTTTATNQFTGGDAVHPNMHPWTAVSFIVKT